MMKLRLCKVTDLNKITAQQVVEREPQRRQLPLEPRGSLLPRPMCGQHNTVPLMLRIQ